MYKAKNLNRILLYFLIAIFTILILALLNLQIIHEKKYKRIAENNFIRIKTLYPVRGEIYDRNFESIVTNKPSHNLYISPGDILDKEKITTFVSNHFEIEKKEVEKIIYQNRFRLFQEILLVQNVSYTEMLNASELFNYYPSLSFKTEAIRNYKYTNHFTGHLGRINEKEYKTLKEEGYSINSFLGKSGLENFYEKLLRGENGHQVLQVDASGNDLNFFKHNLNKSPKNGANLILTIDNKLQNYLSNIFPKNTNGAIVVMDSKTGEILAYVSKPDFDLNIFGKNISSKEWNELLNNANKPMLDRIIHGTYPPGSVFKPIVATLGLEEKLIDEKTKLAECDGEFELGTGSFKCWWHKGHGKLNIVDALKVSCDVFFYDLSLIFPLEKLHEFTTNFRLARKTNVDLPNERTGFFPTKEWFIKNYGKFVSIRGHKVNLAIGQGEILVTPLQICAYYAALANNGVWHQPHLLQKMISEDKTTINEIKSEKLPISVENLNILEESLFKVVNAKYGTGGAAGGVPNIKIYGKTGSAENHMGDKTHAWFAGFAKGENVDISFTIFMENAGHGGSVCAPLAKKIVEYYEKF